MVDLLESRRKIDEIDKEISRLFLERMKVAADVADYKRATGKPVYDRAREEEKLRTIEDFADSAFNKKALHELFSGLMSVSRKYQYSRLKEDFASSSFLKELPPSEKIGFFGGVGSYTELAMKDFFGDKTEGRPYPSFQAICKSIESGEIDYGVLPIENSTTGSIADIYELLSEHHIFILGEKIEPIDHALLGQEGAKFSDITDIFTHAEPILQCSSFLSSLNTVKSHAYGSTSESARMVKESGRKNYAAIASKRRAAFYGLSVLASDIADDRKNATRFILLGREVFSDSNADKINICFDIPHKSGSLYSLISNFIYNNVNMTAIESRALPDKRWKYRFFVELEGNLSDENVQNALHGIKAEAEYFTILGNYVSAVKH